jgi:hypothetical protein
MRESMTYSQTALELLGSSKVAVDLNKDTVPNVLHLF